MGIQHAIREPEMTAFESKFVLDLLQQERPRKLLEVGVAGGGMTDRMLRVMAECPLGGGLGDVLRGQVRTLVPRAEAPDGVPRG